MPRRIIRPFNPTQRTSDFIALVARLHTQSPNAIYFNDLTSAGKTKFIEFFKRETYNSYCARSSVATIRTVFSLVNPWVMGVGGRLASNCYTRWTMNKLSSAIYHVLTNTVVSATNPEQASWIGSVLLRGTPWHGDMPFSRQFDRALGIPCTGQHFRRYMDDSERCPECEVIGRRQERVFDTGRDTVLPEHSGQHPSDTCTPCFEYIMTTVRPTTTSPIAAIQSELASLEDDGDRPPEIRRNIEHIAREERASMVNQTYRQIYRDHFAPSSTFGPSSSI